MNVTLSEAILIGFASASFYKLVISDRITQWLRYKTYDNLNKAGGWLPYHIQYLLGCSMCLTMWAALVFFLVRNTVVGQAIIVVLAARIVGYGLLRWLNEAANRDLPQGVEFPPKK